MTNLALRVYQRLPLPARAVVAAARGWHLRSWRYGPETERLVGEALARERWSEGQWASWQEERLAFVLERAATRVPYYRDQWSARRARGDRASWELLENWPLLDKEPLRHSPRAFVADDCDPRTMFHEHTSGTTGKSLDLWWSRATVREWYALFEARWRRWYGVSRADRWAIIGGQLITPVARRRPPFWVWNPAFGQLYLSAYHLAPDLIPHYLEAMRRYRVRYIYAYTSALHALALGADRRQARALGLQVAVANAEPVLDHQRAIIEDVFGCPVRETYGMSEIVTAASECEHGSLHGWPEAGVVELFEGGSPAAEGSAGDLVCTGLLNADMPLVRYRLGDRAVLAPPSSLEPCGCGRTLFRFRQIEGRIDDMLYTRDGRAVGRMDPVFKSRSPIREAQIIQESLDRVRVRLVPDEGYTTADGDALADRIRDRLGDVVVQLDSVSAIERTSNGKLRAVICALGPEERERLRHASGTIPR